MREPSGDAASARQLRYQSLGPELLAAPGADDKIRLSAQNRELVDRREPRRMRTHARRWHEERRRDVRRRSF